MAQKFSNAARAELSAPLSPGDTSLTLLSGGELFPVANTGTNAISNSYDWFKVVVQDSYGYEIMYVRTHALNGLVLSNILRAQENTTALYFEAGTTVGLRPTAGDMNESVNNRVEKIAGKGLSTEDFTSAEKTKLSGIAANANNYSHPESHPASVIAQDANNRFVTDAEKASWNSKGDVTLTGTQTLTNKTLTAPVVDVVKFVNQVNAGVSGTAVTVNFSTGQKQLLTLTGNAAVTLTFPGVGNYQILLTQDATGNRTATWSGVSRYVGSATAPAINTAANGSTIVSIYYDGTNAWLAASKVNA